MLRLTILLLFALIVNQVSSQEGRLMGPDARVRCFSGERCGDGTEISPDASALECCSSEQMNATSFETIPVDGEQLPACLDCVLIGFTQARFVVQRNGPQEPVSIGLLGGRSANDLEIMVLPNVPPDPDLFVRSARPQEIVFNGDAREATYTNFVLDGGDGVALQPDFIFRVGLNPTRIPSRAGLIVQPSGAEIAIRDPDIVQLRFTAQQFEALEGRPLRPIVSRTLINLARNLSVTVTPGLLLPGTSQSLIPAQLDDFNPAPQTIIFDSSDRGQISADVDIQTINDDINELMESIQFTISVGSDDVNAVNISTPIAFGEITDEDSLSIGFSPTVVNVPEGMPVVITIIDSSKLFPVNGGRRRTAQTQLDRASLSIMPDSAVQADYTFNAEAVPDFTVTNLLLDDLVISNAITAVSDGLLEMTETFFVDVAGVLEQYSVLPRINNVEVNILDRDSVTLRFENNEYTVRENEGPREVCVVATGADFGDGIAVEIQLLPSSFINGTAQSGGDYTIPGSSALLLRFMPNQKRSCFNVPIVDDNVTEPTEQFTITIPPTSFPGLNITVDDNPTTITILDDDTAEIRFERPSYTFRENDGNGDIMVVLDGNVITEVRATVFEISGTFSQEVVFAAGAADQTTTVTIPITDNEIALEDDVVRRFGLRDVSTNLVTIGNPSETSLTIIDDDIVDVNFEQSQYTFSEGDGQGTVSVQISRQIAKTLSVNVFGSSSPQENVVISGGSVDQTIEFAANSVAQSSVQVSVSITDDDIALENVEQYPLSLRNPSITNNVVLGGDTEISITDDDSTAVRFERSSYTFREDDGTGTIMVVLDGTAITEVRATVFEISGTISEEVVFAANMASQSVAVSIPITDNEIALEDNLVRRFRLRDLSTNSVTIGNPNETTVNIIDDDIVDVTFEQSQYTFSEGDEQGTVSVQISRQIAKALSMNVAGSSGPQNNVVVSGGNVEQTVEFAANSPAQTSVQTSVSIADDNVALEDVEQFPLSLSNPSISTNVVLGGNTQIMITDNDAAALQFAQPAYTFSESVGTAQVEVLLSNPVARPVVARVTGGPGNQPSGVVVSGSDVDEEVTFPAITPPSPATVQFDVTNDDIAQEPNEVYSLSLSTTTTGVSVGDDTTITITDDDAASVQFLQDSYTFREGQGSGNITVVLNGAVSSPLTVTVTDGTLTQVVSFEPLIPNQRVNVAVPISDNNVALEPDILRNFQLTQISDSNVPITTPNTTLVRIQDDDVVRVGFAMAGYTFSESTSEAMVVLRASNPVASQFTVRVQGGPGTQPSSVVVSGSDINEVFTFPASSTAETISVPIEITDDLIGLEEDEVYRLLLTDIDSRVILNGNGFSSTTLITIEDNDDVVVTVTTPPTTVPEDGSTVDVCASLSREAATTVTVNFNTVETSATAGADFRILSSSVDIVRPIRSGCVQYEILEDNLVEGDEQFTPQISTVSGGATIGNPSSTTITIEDSSPSEITCTVSQVGTIVTFPGVPNGQTYQFARPCEHALLTTCAETNPLDFGVFIDTTDGTLATASVGVRLLDSRVVVDASNRAIVVGSQIQVQATNEMTTITVPSLDVVVTRTSTQVSVVIGETSSLVSDCGLCGNRNGDLVLPNRTTVATPSEQFITAFQVLPGDAFLMPNRRQCGVLDTVRGDPVYTVPILTPSTTREHTLCYEIYGHPNQFFNLVSDVCVNVNAHYAMKPRQARDFHIIDKVTVRATDTRSRCRNIAAELVGNECRVSVDDQMLTNTGTRYTQNGITIRSYPRRARITVPNCDNIRLVMWVICETRFGFNMIQYRITRGFNLRPTSHGLLGQFWNVPVNVSKFSGDVQVGDPSKVYVVTIQPPSSPTRRVGAFLEAHRWDGTPQSCLYAGNAQGGPMGEVKVSDPQDSLIEGKIDNYRVHSPFDTDFLFEQFDETSCSG